MEAMRLDTGLTLRRTGPFRIDATDKCGELEFEGRNNIAERPEMARS